VSYEADCKAAWHTVDSGDGFTGSDGNALSVSATYQGTPARKPVTWDRSFKWGEVGATTGLTELPVRSWSFTIEHNVEGVPNIAGDGTGVAYLGGFYLGDLSMTLSLTIASEDSAWIVKRLTDPDTLFDVVTAIDNAQIRFGSCRLAMDQSAMTAQNGYDETLTIEVRTLKYTISGVAPRSAPPEGDGDTRSAPAEEPDEEPGERRGRWSPTTTGTSTPGGGPRTRSRGPTPPSR
jgi:hypothetical protein